MVWAPGSQTCAPKLPRQVGLDLSLAAMVPPQRRMVNPRVGAHGLSNGGSLLSNEELKARLHSSGLSCFRQVVRAFAGGSEAAEARERGRVGQESWTQSLEG